MGASDLLKAALDSLEAKPDNSAPQKDKRRYSERMSQVVALALAEALRERGCTDTRPAAPGHLGGSGAERRLAGGIGAKKVDVSWATEESGLLLGVSIKTINWRDGVTKNFQKNVTNRRGDMLIEAVTLHRRFPYAVLGGLLFLDHQAASDQTDTRRSTFENVHPRFQLFTGRNDPAGRDEQYEGLYVVLVNASPFKSTFEIYEVGHPHEQLQIDEVLTALLTVAVERNFDFYEFDDQRQIIKI